MERKSEAELVELIHAGNLYVPVLTLTRHVMSQQSYIVLGHLLRESDLAVLVMYSPVGGAPILFSRPIDEFVARFVRQDGKPWGNRPL